MTDYCQKHNCEIKIRTFGRSMENFELYCPECEKEREAYFNSQEYKEHKALMDKLDKLERRISLGQELMAREKDQSWEHLDKCWGKWLRNYF